MRVGEDMSNDTQLQKATERIGYLSREVKYLKIRLSQRDKDLHAAIVEIENLTGELGRCQRTEKR